MSRKPKFNLKAGLLYGLVFLLAATWYEWRSQFLGLGVVEFQVAYIVMVTFAVAFGGYLSAKLSNQLYSDQVKPGVVISVLTLCGATIPAAGVVMFALRLRLDASWDLGAILTYVLSSLFMAGVFIFYASPILILGLAMVTILLVLKRPLLGNRHAF
jgi:hypothetical protein